MAMLITKKLIGWKEHYIGILVNKMKCIICGEPLLNNRAKYCPDCKVELWSKRKTILSRKKEKNEILSL